MENLMKHIYILFSHLKLRGIICKKTVKDNISLDNQISSVRTSTIRANSCSESVMTKLNTNFKKSSITSESLKEELDNVSLSESLRNMFKFI